MVAMLEAGSSNREHNRVDVNPTRLTGMAHEEDRPIAPGCNAAAWHWSRRVA
jgi:hypothetical protein